MSDHTQVLEGIWEDIRSHDAELKGRRVRLTILGANGMPAPFFTNGADLMAYWKREGLVGSRSDITDRVTHAQEMRKKAETRS